ncbi:MAG: LTA synthase family protein [Candidatus Amulumruptor sp.]|nr:LTA synthase family protein [Candidatus Amulumruptor sp.]
MGSRILRIIVLFVGAVAVMALGKLLFMLCLPDIYGGYGFGDYMSAMGAGLRMDCSMAGYLTIFPGLVTVLSVWLLPQPVKRILSVYYLLAALLVAGAATIDTILYSYWGMKLDTTPLFYFASSPSLALVSVPVWQIVAGVAGWLAVSALIWLWFRLLVRLTEPPVRERLLRRGRTAGVVLLLTALLFIPIRGGVTVSTMNLSSAYFSTDQRLNHAAVNPVFSLLYSASHSDGFASGMRYFDSDSVASSLAAPALAPAAYQSTAADSLLTVDRPDILLVILESFSSHLLPSQGGEAIAVKLDSIARSGLLFSSVYASSFRTDRAIPAILSGIVAPPNEPLMKHTAIAERLPGLPAALRRAGYRTAYYYGGDINFTNQRAYLLSAGIDTIVSDVDFPINRRVSKWGVADGPLYERILADEERRDDRAPRFTVVQTSSSHEPFDVGDFTRHSDPAANAFAYADSCLGAFVDSLALSPRWNRTLVVMVPDHYGCYPRGLDEAGRHHVPLVMTGGALAQRGIVATPGAQSDIAATLLAALRLPAADFPFSRDLLATPSPALSIFSEPDFAVGVGADGTMTRLDLTGDTAAPADSASRRLAATLQTLYIYLSNLASPDLSSASSQQ